MAITVQDASRLNSAQQAALQGYTDQWNAAFARGDQAAMDSAHAAAEAIRNSAGYYSNDDGTYAGERYDNYPSYADDILPGYTAIVDKVQTNVQENNAVAQSMAQDQWAFNAAEAQQSRNWSEYMSNTAHQREVRDLIAAGLNPVLSVGGNGAAAMSGASASGSSASPDTSLNSVFGSFLTSLINSATAINTANMSAKSASNVARINTEMNYKIAHDFPTQDKVIGEVLQKFLDWILSGSKEDDHPYSDKVYKGTDLRPLK